MIKKEQSGQPSGAMSPVDCDAPEFHFKRKHDDDLEIIRLFEQNKDGDSPLHLAIIDEDTDYALYLIQCAPSSEFLNLPNNLFQTPLHLATILESETTVDALLAHGADRQARDRKGDTALHRACRNGTDDIVSVLIKRKFLLHQMQKEKYIKYLNSRNYDGYAPIHLASEGSQFGVISNLVKNGADINVRDDKSGKTALHFATESRNVKLVDYLVRFPDIDIDARSYAGYTSVMLAHSRKCAEIFSLLFSHGARLELEVGNGSESNDGQLDDSSDDADDICCHGVRTGLDTENNDNFSNGAHTWF